MKLEMKSIINHTLSQITAAQFYPKNPRSSEEKPRKALTPRSGDKTPDLTVAPLAK